MSSKSPPELKPLAWLASTKKDLMALPELIKERLKAAEQVVKELLR